VKFIEDSKIVGLAIFHLDKDYLRCKRLKIIHFTCIKSKNFEILFKKLIKFIWDIDKACEDIRYVLKVII
jgi:hypothetical protein